MKKTYAGPAGLFLKGDRHDLPPATLAAIRKTLGKGAYVKAGPWWNDHKTTTKKGQAKGKGK
jgi:hypothetical protein